MELDREKRSDFYLTLFAKNKDGKQSPTEVIINLTDENDNAPQFSRQTYTVFLKENATNLDVVTVHVRFKRLDSTYIVYIYIYICVRSLERLFIIYNMV